MKEEIVVNDLFRFSYGTIQLKENLKEMNKMVQVIKKKNRSVLLSNRGGYQSPNIEVDQIPGYKDFAIKVLRLYVWIKYGTHKSKRIINKAVKIFFINFPVLI